MTPRPYLVLVSLVLLLAACNGDGGRAEMSGQELAADVGCLGCHQENPTDIAPSLHGIWGTQVSLEDGSTVTVDEAYVRRSIAEPGADIVEGYGASMPDLDLSDSEIDRLVQWVESLG